MKAPNLRETQSCNNCLHSVRVGGDRPGGIAVECTKYEDVYSTYNDFVCDAYKDMDDE